VGGAVLGGRDRRSCAVCHAEALKLEPRTLRLIGAGAIAVGLIALHLLQG
jgi:uncharacterized protein YjeT (DUF2065 family)